MPLPSASHFFVADIHWQPATGERPDPGGAFGRFLDELATVSPCQLYILGDLFDYWLERGDRYFDFYQPHVERLAQATVAGVQIHLLFGNRDFTYAGALPKRAGVEIVGDRVALELHGRRLLLQHGDLWCSADRRYQLYRRVVRSTAVASAARLVPWTSWPRLIGAMRRASAAEVARKAPRALRVVETTIASEAARGHDLLICGHVHQPERRPIAGQPGAELITLGPWDADGGWYVAGGPSGFSLNRFD